jgi:hypothetical protein
MNRQALTIVFLLLSARVSIAQTADPRVFVTGGVFAGIERTSQLTSSALVVDVPDLDGTAPGGVVGIGTFLTPRFSVRAEFAFRGPLTAETTRTETLSTLPPVSYTERLRGENRMNTGAVLAAYHTRAGSRVSVEYLAGISITYLRERAVTEATTTGPLPAPFPSRRSETTITEYGTVAMVGMDVAVSVTSRLALVPHVRVQAAGGLSLRPGVSIRVAF